MKRKHSKAQQKSRLFETAKCDNAMDGVVCVHRIYVNEPHWKQRQASCRKESFSLILLLEFLCIKLK